MFANTVLLSAALFIRGDAQSDLVINNLDDVESAGDSVDSVESSEEMEAPDAVRRLMPPQMRKEGEACGTLFSGLFGKCDLGLYCKYFTRDGTSTEGKCVRRQIPFPNENNGDINQPCNRAPLAPCNYDYLEGVWRHDFCTCEPRHEHHTGGPNQRCNEGPSEWPCNDDDLQPQYEQLYPSGESCTCVYILGSSNKDSEAKSGTPKLGVRAPEMGGEGEPCAYQGGCNYGLRPHYFTRDGSSTECKCVRDSQPQPRYPTGGLNQECNQPPVAPCNNDDLQGIWQSGRCTCEPRSRPSPKRGEANGRCNPAPYAPCNHNNLQAHWEHLLPSGESCTCVYLLGAAHSDVDENSNGPKLGRSHTGDVGEKCNTSGSPCNCHREPCDQVVPDYSTGHCMCMIASGPAPTPSPATGEAGGRCNKAPLSPCNHSNLAPKYHHMLPSGESCTCEYHLGETDEDSTQKLGVRAPEMGGEGEPCAYQGGCNYGLRPHYFTRDGSSTECKCVRDSQPQPRYPHGGLNQQCNQAPKAPCNTDDLRAVWQGRLCTCEPRSRPSPKRGEAHGRCNPAPYAPCNHNNLQPHYEQLLPSGESCTCVYLLGSSDEDSNGPKLGRSHTGDVGEKCNTSGSPCNCHREPCDQVVPDYSTGHCMCMIASGPAPTPSPATGEAGGRCNKAPLSPCNHSDLAPKYHHMLPSGESCVCEYHLGESQESAKLGMRAPEMGGEGEPCRNTPGDECNQGMYCKITNHGSWTSGVCLRQYMPEFGKLGEPCDNGQCDAGLHCKVTWHGSFSTNVCEKQSVERGHTGQQCNLLGSQLPECFDENDFCKEVHLLPSGTTYICTQKIAQVGDRCGDYAAKVGSPTKCAAGLVCKEHNMYPSGKAQICEEKQQQGGANQPCRWDSINTCNDGLVCNYFDQRGPTCIYWLGNDGAASAPGN